MIFFEVFNVITHIKLLCFEVIFVERNLVENIISEIWDVFVYLHTHTLPSLIFEKKKKGKRMGKDIHSLSHLMLIRLGYHYTI